MHQPVDNPDIWYRRFPLSPEWLYISIVGFSHVHHIMPAKMGFRWAIFPLDAVRDQLRYEGVTPYPTP